MKTNKTIKWIAISIFALLHSGLDNYTHYRKELCDQQQQGIVRASDRHRPTAL